MAKSFSEALAAKKAADREKTLEMLVATSGNLECVENQLVADLEEVTKKQATLSRLVERHELGEDVTSEVSKLYSTIKPPKTDHWR